MTHRKLEVAEVIEAFWIEKYLTYIQRPDGTLESTDHIFLAEYALRNGVEDAHLFDAEFFRIGSDTPIASYSGADRLWCNRKWVNRKARSFDSLQELDQAFPPSDQYYWKIGGAHFECTTTPLCLGGPHHVTEIPRPHALRLYQDNAPVADCMNIAPGLPLYIEWDQFPDGKPGMLFDDLIFLFIDNHEGEVVYFGGLPIDPDYITYRSTSATIPANTMKPGEPYTVFYSQCRMVDQNESQGVFNVAVNSFGMELEIHTRGTPAPGAWQGARKMAPFRWKRKTQVPTGLETWPTILDN